MRVIEWYFAFNRPSTATIWQIFGHVQVFGYTEDEMWVFFDPERELPTMRITRKYDEVNAEMSRLFEVSDEIIRMPASEKKHAIPPLTPLTCASACAIITGLRAFSVGGLRRKVLAHGGEVLKDGRSQRRSRG